MSIRLENISQSAVIEILQSKNKNGFLPRHFIESTLPRIGGETIGLFAQGKIIGCGFSIPVITPEGVKYVIRGHRLENEHFEFPDGWLDVERFRKENFAGQILSINNSFDIAHPDHKQAKEAMMLQQKTWGQGAALYPFDLYRDGSGSDTRLVALDKEGRTIGFLLGFAGVGDKWMGDKNGTLTKRGIWIESQIAAVGNSYRENGVAKALKWQQYDEAETRGISLVHWTVDPLQAANAGLNYGLGAIAAEFTPNYYSFRNEKNKVAASRFGIYWLVDSDRANLAKAGRLEQKNFVEFQENPSTLIINPLLNTPNLDNLSAENILIEIPENWDEVQKNNIELAVQWRNRTDAIFGKIIGVGRGNYVITGRVLDGKTPYLIAQRFEDVYK